MQVLYSRALDPLIVAAWWAVPLAIAVGFGDLVRRRLHRAGDLVPSRALVRRQRARDNLFLLTGASLGTIASRVPVFVWAEGRLGMLLVLPAAGAALGLIAGALVPASEPSATATASLRRRRLSDYSNNRDWAVLCAASAATATIMVARWIVPRGDPSPPIIVAKLGRPLLAPTPALYSGLAIFAVGLCVGARAAAAGIAHRRRPSGDLETLRIQDDIRGSSIRRLVAWCSGTILLLDAAMLTVLPGKMGGVVLGHIQLIQRATDVATIGLVIFAVAFIAAAHLSGGRVQSLADSG